MIKPMTWQLHPAAPPIPGFALVTPAYVNISANVAIVRTAIASADKIADGTWWISRVLVPQDYRGQGIGTRLLQQLQAEIVGVDPAARVHVCPGGYGGNVKRQQRFYEKSGFRNTFDEDAEVWVWAPTKTVQPQIGA